MDLTGNGSRMKFIYSRDVVRSRFGRWGEGLFHQPAGIFSTNALRRIGFRDWCGEVMTLQGIFIITANHVRT